MFTLLGSLLGFIGSLFPELLRMFRDRQDKSHEVKLLQLQIEREKMGFAHRLEEIHVLADMAETKTLARTYHSAIRWVEALNGTVRPVLAYAFFGMYAALKIATFVYSLKENPGSAIPYGTLWTEEDSAIFAGIMSFYFGSRSMQKARIGR